MPTYARFNHPEPFVGLKTLLSGKESSRPATSVMGSLDEGFVGVHSLSAHQTSLKATRVNRARDCPVLLRDQVVGNSRGSSVRGNVLELFAKLLVAEEYPVVAVLVIESLLELCDRGYHLLLLLL